MPDTPIREETSERRDDMCFWQDYKHLKNAYVKYLDPQKIDEIYKKIKDDKKFIKRKDETESEHDAELCNLIEKEILKQIKI